MNSSMVETAPALKADARQRILEAAGEAFAEYGFNYVTVRQICAMAGVNVAAINYHFGDKESLYKVVLKHWERVAFEKYPLHTGEVDGDLPPEQRLRAFIKSFLFRMLDDGRPSWFGKLVAREFIEPTGALDMLVEDAIRPSYALLSSIVRELLGRDAGEDEVSLCCASIVGQCIYFHNARAIVRKLYGQEKFSAGDIERLAEHVTGFSLGGIIALGGSGGRS